MGRGGLWKSAKPPVTPGLPPSLIGLKPTPEARPWATNPKNTNPKNSRLPHRFALFVKGRLTLNSLVSRRLLDRFELGDLHGAFGEAGGDFQFSAHGFSQIVQAKGWATAQGLKPDLYSWRLRGAEAPLFLGGGECGAGRGKQIPPGSLRSRVGMTRLSARAFPTHSSPSAAFLTASNCVISTAPSGKRRGFSVLRPWLSGDRAREGMGSRTGAEECA